MDENGKIPSDPNDYSLLEIMKYIIADYELRKVTPDDPLNNEDIIKRNAKKCLPGFSL